MRQKRQGFRRNVPFRVRQYYDDTQIAELTLLIGHYMMTARFLETLEVDLDESATPWDAVLNRQGAA